MNKPKIFSGRQFLVILLTLSAVLSLKISLSEAGPGEIKWRYPISSHSCYSPAIGQNNVIYAPSGNYMLAINPNGTLRWSFEAGGTVNTPSVGLDGNIYFQSNDGVYSLNSSGDILWLYNPDGSWSGSDCAGRIAVDNDSTIYASRAGGELHAIDSNGQNKWVSASGSIPAIGKEGTLYGHSCGGTTCILNKTDGLPTTCASTVGYSWSPSLGLNGEVYIAGNTSLVALYPDLDNAWEYTEPNNHIYPPGQAVNDSEGVVYVLSWNVGDGQFLHAINPDGTQKWILDLCAPSGSPAVGNDGIIYVSSNCAESGLTAIDNTGTTIWFTIPIKFQIFSSPIIGNDGTVYVIGGEYENGQYYSHLYAIETSSTGPASSSWPMMGANAQHTYRVGSAIPITPAIAQTPMSGPPGTAFTQWGTDFTPNSVGTLYTRNPDGSEHYIQDIDIDEAGHFEITYESPIDKEPGTYAWWVIDGPTQIKSNEVSYEITGPEQATLTISLDPQETGKVRSISDAGIRCGKKCEKIYSQDTQVTLEETPKKGWKFDYWDDGLTCNYENPTTITMDSDKLITARFVQMNQCDKDYSKKNDCVNWVRHCTPASEWLPTELWTLEDKVNEIDTNIAEGGAVAVMNTGHWGHVGYVKFVIGSKVTIEESGIKVGIITTRTGTEEELNIVGYIKE